MKRSLITKALKGLRWIFEKEIVPLIFSSINRSTFLATKVWTAGVCITIMTANSRIAIATMMIQNILSTLLIVYKCSKYLG